MSTFSFARVREQEYLWTRLEQAAALALSPTREDAVVENIRASAEAEPSRLAVDGPCPCCQRGE